MLRVVTASAAAGAAAAALTGTVASDGSYSLALDGKTWFTSAQAGYVLRYDGATHSLADGSLKVDKVSPVAGLDPILGAYTGSEVSVNGGIASFRVLNCANYDAVVFEQYFPNGLTGTAFSGSNAASDLATAFPVWGAPMKDLKQGDLGYLAFAHVMSGGVWGNWSAHSVGRHAGDFGDEGGIIAWFDAAGNTILQSAANDFMVTTLAFADSTGTAWGAGFNGMISGLPAGHTHRTIMVGGQGVNETFFTWGSALLALGGKARPPLYGHMYDKLGYWTDNGAYYYYNTQGSTTYQDTLVAVKQQYAQLGLPLSYIMLDSWWYFKSNVTAVTSQDEPTTPLGGPKGALLLWEPMPELFPSGMSPSVLGTPLALHNRYFDVDNNYTKMNYAFLYQDGAKLSLPIDEAMFRYIMAKGKAWGNGQLMYEQDWLNIVWQGIPAQTKANLTAAHDWLMAMSNAAASLDTEVQYCMSLPNFMLHSTLSQPVTNARASGDYHPGSDQFVISLTSLFFWAVGVQPSKDDWWTTEVQPGNPYGDNPTEPNWQLQAIVIALSTGPNGPSDMLNGVNASLIWTTIAGDGTTLKPARPAITVPSALAYAIADQPMPHVSATWTQLDDTASASGDAYRWHFVLAAELTAPFSLQSADLGPALSATGYAVFDYFQLRDGAAPAGVLPASGGSFLIASGQGQPSAPSRALPIRYHIAAPVLPGGWALAGEAGKIVSVSSYRFSGLATSGSGFSVLVATFAGEGSVNVLVGKPGASTVSAVPCAGGNGRTMTLSCSTASGCACA